MMNSIGNEELEGQWNAEIKKSGYQCEASIDILRVVTLSHG